MFHAASPAFNAESGCSAEMMAFRILLHLEGLVCRGSVAMAILYPDMQSVNPGLLRCAHLHVLAMGAGDRVLHGLGHRQVFLWEMAVFQLRQHGPMPLERISIRIGGKYGGSEGVPGCDGGFRDTAEVFNRRCLIRGFSSPPHFMKHIDRGSKLTLARVDTKLCVGNFKFSDEQRHDKAEEPCTDAEGGQV